ncbi:MAG: signal peptidase I, partial [Candidatus Aenigmarchaeota archaeon]|nr:signal peptidase I [Candidatus Aenigmarchaeota archaeon]
MEKMIVIKLVLLVVFLLIFASFLLKVNDKGIKEIVNNKTNSEIETVNYSCVRTEKHRIVGKSLEPVIFSGQEVILLRGYYDCNPVKRGDIVIFSFKTTTNIYVKKVLGLPGDKIEFENNYLKVNGVILKNSMNQTYFFTERSKEILTKPLEDGRIPNDKLLVLGEDVRDSF